MAATLRIVSGGLAAARCRLRIVYASGSLNPGDERYPKYYALCRRLLSGFYGIGDMGQAHIHLIEPIQQFAAVLLGVLTVVSVNLDLCCLIVLTTDSGCYSCFLAKTVRKTVSLFCDTFRLYTSLSYKPKREQTNMNELKTN